MHRQKTLRNRSTYPNLCVKDYANQREILAFEWDFRGLFLEVTSIRPMASVQNGGPLNDLYSKILNLWTNKLCFESIHGLLVFVFDKISKLKLSMFTAQYSSCNL